MSKIEVNTVEPQCGTTLTVGGGAGQTAVVNATTVTLGRCGGTVALATGATQTGFGKTGAVDWQTSSIKTATFTAVNGEGYFCNTVGGSFEMDLPAGSAGAIVSVQDYNNTFDDNALTVDPNGSEKINGGVGGGTVSLSVEGQGITFVYIDATVGWRTVAGTDDPFAQAASNYVVATGGTIVTCGDYKTHIFTGPGTFCVASGGTPSGSNTVDYFVVAGGGGSGAYTGCNQGIGGGGAGGFRLSNGYSTPAPLTSPLAAPAGLAVPAQGYPITVGAGGAGGSLPSPDSSVAGVAGDNSIFSTITSAGGGGADVTTTGAGGSGGSGSGGGRGNATTQTRGIGNTPPVSPSQGFDGGDGTPMPEQPSPAPAPARNGGGGGGASARGGDGGSPGSGAGGAGSYLAPGFVGPTAPDYGTPGPVSARYFAGGGGGTGGSSSQPGGTGGGGAGASSGPSGGSGTANTGGGGGGSICASYPGAGGSGGSGIVMIRYKFQN